MDQVAQTIARQVEQEHALEIDRKRALLLRCGVAEEDLSKVRLCAMLSLSLSLFVFISVIAHESLDDQNGQVYLHVLSEVAELLALKDTKSSSYLMAMAYLEDALDDAEKEAKALRVAAEEGRRRSQELAREWKQLKSVKRQLEDAVDEREKHENTNTMMQRTEEYSEKQRAYEDELMRLRATLQELQIDELHKDKSSHQALSTLEQECKAIEAQNRAIRDQLLAFHGLPLSKELAAAQLFEARAELQRLEDQFSSQIQQML